MLEYQKYEKDLKKYGNLQNFTTKNGRLMKTLRNDYDRWCYYVLITKEERKKLEKVALKDMVQFTYFGENLIGDKKLYPFMIGGDFGDPPINFCPLVYKLSSNPLYSEGSYMTFEKSKNNGFFDNFAEVVVKKINK